MREWDDAALVQPVEPVGVAQPAMGYRSGPYSFRAEGTTGDQQRSRCRDWLGRPDCKEDLFELSAIPHLDHGLERYLRAGRAEQPGCVRINVRRANK